MLKRLMRLTLLTLLLGLTTYMVVLQQEDVIETDPVLTADATLDEIIDALLTAHEQYDTIYLQITSDDQRGNIVHNEVWMSQSANAFRDQRTVTTAEGEIFQNLEVSSGSYMSVVVGGEQVVVEMNASPRAVAHILQPMATMIAPENLAVRLGAPNPAAAAGLSSPARDNVEIEIVDVETISDRETIKVIYSDEWQTWHYWIDIETGIVMQYQALTPSGEVADSTSIDAVIFDPIFEDPETLFFVDSSKYDDDWLDNYFVQPAEATEQP
jgi:hypothetical protein